METIKLTTVEKNQLALKILKSGGLNVKMLANDINKPNFIVGRKCLPCMVEGNIMKFYKEHNGDVDFEINLEETVLCNARTFKILGWFAKCKTKQLYVITVEHIPFNIYLTGFQKSNDLGVAELKPVFSEVEPKLYFNKERAESVAKKYSNNNITLIVE